jgi:hypothetical protein
MGNKTVNETHRETGSGICNHPFKEASLPLYKRGYSVVPLVHGTKRPYIKGWSALCKEKASRQDMNKWYKGEPLNIGLALGEASGLIALDFDYDKDGMHDKVREVLTDDTICKTANKGFTTFFRFNGERPQKWSIDGESVLELLSTGNQTVLPPSVHPEGGIYRYTTRRTLGTCSLHDIPYLPTNFIQEVDNLFGKKNHKATQEGKEFHCSKQKIETALTYVSQEDYYTWVKVGMALKASFKEEGYKIWDNWSRRSHKYKEEGMRERWEGFKGEGTTLGSIFYWAKEGGYGNGR